MGQIGPVGLSCEYDALFTYHVAYHDTIFVSLHVLANDGDDDFCSGNRDPSLPLKDLLIARTMNTVYDGAVIERSSQLQPVLGESMCWYTFARVRGERHMSHSCRGFSVRHGEQSQGNRFIAFTLFILTSTIQSDHLLLAGNIMSSHDLTLGYPSAFGSVVSEAVLADIIMSMSCQLKRLLHIGVGLRWSRVDWHTGDSLLAGLVCGCLCACLYGSRVAGDRCVLGWLADVGVAWGIWGTGTMG